MKAIVFLSFYGLFIFSGLLQPAMSAYPLTGHDEDETVAN
jgi:hypothetical protein